MRREIFLNPGYSDLKQYVRQIPDNFDKLGEPVKLKRNEIRAVNVDGRQYVIKYYKKITVINRIIYSFFRKSKARRAYEHSAYMIDNNISSPTPVAYINCYRYGILARSYYMCLYTSYSLLKDLLDLPFPECADGLKAFARFTYKLHKAGIYHGDYSTTNVLYKIIDGEYDFSLIDNNNMKIGRYRYLKGIRSMKRLEMPLVFLSLIAEEYGNVADIKDVAVMHDMTLFKLLNFYFSKIKRLVKGCVKK